ncbi:armadillo-type protein [Fomitopsis serialis]|uniref:armadillo-type protein n=1 Tax=Fomitopsis serialis TaxID=139415 RepID=UPI002007D721|nr:armadillo-type protein [Neoantrodia serialis]KAH9926472.1 armadillo-type protein [Neoantrodia serialis]
MDQPAAARPFDPFFDMPLPNPSRSIHASIWAPQPQPSETAWTKAIDSFTRVDSNGHPIRPDPRRTSSFPSTCEDLFGPPGADSRMRRHVGAIGDGRKKGSPTLEQVVGVQINAYMRACTVPHSEPQLSRSGPQLVTTFGQPQQSSQASPDLSPISNTALLTPSDSPSTKTFDVKPDGSHYGLGVFNGYQGDRLFETGPPPRHSDPYRDPHVVSRSGFPSAHQRDASTFPFLEPLSEVSSPIQSSQPFLQAAYPQPTHRRLESAHGQQQSWTQQPRMRAPSGWVQADERSMADFVAGSFAPESTLRSSQSSHSSGKSHAHEPINFLSLLHPSSSPPYTLFVDRIIRSSDQQASIFLQQKLKVADGAERAKIVDAICSKGFEMMAHRFGNWAVQRCLEATASPEERRKIVACMRGRVVDLATNCYGCHVLQKALDCEEDVRLLIVSELLLGDPAQTLVNKHASHVWSKVMELTWTSPHLLFRICQQISQGQVGRLACHETGSLVVSMPLKPRRVGEGWHHRRVAEPGSAVLPSRKSQWGSYCVQHILEHGSKKHRDMALDHLLAGLLEYATNEQGVKSVTKALKEGGKETLDKIIKRMCEPAKGGRRVTIVDWRSDEDGTGGQRSACLLYDSIRGHIVTLRGCKTGSKVIWLFDRMASPAHEYRAYYGY